MAAIHRHQGHAWRWWADGFLFITVLIAGQLLAIHGKAAASRLFDSGTSFIRGSSGGGWAITAAVFAALTLTLLRLCDWRGRSKARLGAIVCLLAPLPELWAAQPSILVVFLHMAFLAMAGGVVWAETLLSQPMQGHYWELLFDYAVKAAKLLLVGYGAVVTILGVVVDRKGEEVIGYLTTLAYPTLIVAMILFMFAYWVMEPAWQQIAASHRKRTYLRNPS